MKNALLLAALAGIALSSPVRKGPELEAQASARQNVEISYNLSDEDDLKLQTIVQSDTGDKPRCWSSFQSRCQPVRLTADAIEKIKQFEDVTVTVVGDDKEPSSQGKEASDEKEEPSSKAKGAGDDKKDSTLTGEEWKRVKEIFGY